MDVTGALTRTAEAGLTRLGLSAWADALLKWRVNAAPSDVHALARRGDLLGKRGGWDGARELYEKAILRDPRYSGAWLSLGIAYLMLNRVDEAIRALGRTIELDPNSQEAQYRLATGYLRAGRLQDALSSARRALSMDPSDHIAAGQVGAVLYRMGHTSEALPSLRRAASVSRDPAHSYTLGIALLELRQLDEAEKALRAAVSLDPASVASKLPLGEVLCRQDRFDEAIDLVKDQLAAPEPDVDAVNLLVEAYRLDERYDEAIHAAKVNVRHHPDVSSAHGRLARAFLSSGDPESALSEYFVARRLDPSRVDYTAGFAAVRCALGNTEEARVLFEEVVAIEPAYFDRDPELADYLAKSKSVTP